MYVEWFCISTLVNARSGYRFVCCGSESWTFNTRDMNFVPFKDIAESAAS